MKAQTYVPALAALATLAFSPASQAAVIVNGSFETPLAPLGSFDTFGAGSTAITGWTVLGVNASIVSGTSFDNPMTFQAQSGDQFIDLTGPGSNNDQNGVAQDVVTVAGQLYTLSFYVGSGSGATFTASTVDLSINGGSRISFTNPNLPTTNLDWQLFSVDFTASGPVTNIAFYNGSDSSNHLSALDNVSISSIPEPSAFATLAGAAGLAVALVRRRPRRLMSA